ncbi:MAG: hypothetical protein WCD80_02550 [Desulfobaccales bacterium]
MRRYFSRMVMALMLVSFWCAAATADYKDDIGYTALANELGAGLPTGAGVKVTQVEAACGEPDPSLGEFAGKTFTIKSPNLVISGHANAVGQIFYGNSGSIAPGITSIDCYSAGSWTQPGFLRYDTSTPLISSSRVANHSWGGSDLTAGYNIAILARLDWVVDRDEYINVVGMNNGGAGVNAPLLGSSFNAIAVGLSNGSAAYGSYALATTPSTPYASGSRTRPDLVAPSDYTSYATPMVSAAAALLVQEGHNGGTTLSTDPVVRSTTNRNGDTIYNAERSEVVKAALMAGASRTSPNFSQSYVVNTANGLNNVYGAGQLNIYNSYHVIAGGEQNSREDYLAGGGEIKGLGFDYDPAFGGANASNKTGTYIFHTLTSGDLSASLVWNLKVAGITGQGFDTTATLYHLGLYLYDVSDSNRLVASSDSSVDNTQNLWTSLNSDKIYQLVVKVDPGQLDFLWDYGLAWDITAVTTHAPVPGSVYLLASGLVAILWLKRKGVTRS